MLCLFIHFTQIHHRWQVLRLSQTANSGSCSWACSTTNNHKATYHADTHAHAEECLHKEWTTECLVHRRVCPEVLLVTVVWQTECRRRTNFIRFLDLQDLGSPVFLVLEQGGQRPPRTKRDSLIYFRTAWYFTSLNPMLFYACIVSHVVFVPAFHTDIS